MPHETLTIWTVYRRPKDFPDDYVARRGEVGNGTIHMTHDIKVASRFEDLRAMMPADLTVIPRHPSDEPHIVECWI